MEKKIRIFKSLEEQEHYFLSYFAALTPSERLRSLAQLQRTNFNGFFLSSGKKLTVHKRYFANGH